jgi:TatD DNase family protein
MFDSHAHLDMSDFDADRELVIERAEAVGVDTILTVGIDIQSSLAALALARRYPGLYASAGCHPHNSRDFSSARADSLADIASAPEVVAWGEIGLDYFRNNSPKEAQRKAFAMQLERAWDMNLPVVIHDREAHDEILHTVKRMGKRPRCGVIHCFSGDLNLAAQFISLGYYISIPGTVTYSKADQVRKTAAGISIEHILVETDSPFLAPVPRRGKRNEPAYVSYTVEALAGLKGMDPQEASRITAANARKLFGIPGSG